MEWTTNRTSKRNKKVQQIDHEIAKWRTKKVGLKCMCMWKRRASGSTTKSKAEAVKRTVMSECSLKWPPKSVWQLTHEWQVISSLKCTTKLKTWTGSQGKTEKVRKTMIGRKQKMTKNSSERGMNCKKVHCPWICVLQCSFERYDVKSTRVSRKTGRKLVRNGNRVSCRGKDGSIESSSGGAEKDWA